MYVADISSKCTSNRGSPVVIKETVATALVDGQNLLGPVTGKFCMDLAIEKAKAAGIGLVSARRKNSYFFTQKFYSNPHGVIPSLAFCSFRFFHFHWSCAESAGFWNTTCY